MISVAASKTGWMRWLPVVLLFLCLRATLPALELHVDAMHGSDQNDGLTPQTALKTIRSAVDRAEPGTAIRVYPGQYDESVVLKKGAPGKPIRLSAVFPGMSLIGKPIPLIVQKGSAFPVVRAKVDADRIFGVVDLRNGWLRRVAGEREVDRLAGSFSYLKEQGVVAAHLAGFEGVDQRVLLGIRNLGSGVVMASHTVLEGVTIAGFGSAGIQIDDAEDVEIRNCRLYANACGIAAFGGRDLRILDNRLWRNGWENNPLWWKGRPSSYPGQIIFNPIRSAMEKVLVEDNLAAYSQGHGIRFYSGRGVRDTMVRGNVVYQSGQMGIFYKTDILGDASAENNVAFLNTQADLRAPIAVDNLVGRLTTYYANPDGWRLITRGNEKLSAPPGRPLFLAPEYDDFRLQPASPLSRTPAATAFSKRRGSTVTTIPSGQPPEAWSSTLEAGQTVLLTSGSPGGELLLDGLKAAPGRPTIIRGEPGRQVVFSGLVIRNSANLSVQGIAIGKKGVRLENSRGITLDHLAVSAAESDGLAVKESADIRLRQSEISGGVHLDGLSRRVSLIGSTFHREGKPHLVADGEKLSLALSGNRFSGDAPFLAHRGVTHASAAAATLPGLWNLPFPIREGERDFGPSHAAGKIDRFIDQVQLLSSTPTTANLTFRTPGVIVGAMIEWGESREYGRKMDHAGFDSGDYETFHTVSLIDLKPGTTYHYRVGFRDPWMETETTGAGFPIRDVEDRQREVWSEDFTFTTPEKDRAPRRLFVATDGDDSRDGETPVTAWKTLHKAAQEAGPGDVVTLAPGRYLELLQPLRTGASQEQPVVFRAERPLSVVIDGGAGRDSGEVPIDEFSSRSYCVAVHAKAFVHFENLVFYGSALRQNQTRGLGDAYSGQVDLSGSLGIRFSGCVFDGRGTYNVGLRARNAGDMAGAARRETPAFTVADSLFFHSFYMAVLQAPQADCVFEESALVNGQIYGIVTDFQEENRGRLVLRRNVIAPLAASLRKLRHPFLYQRGPAPIPVVSNGNCFVWDREDTARNIVADTPLAQWRQATGQDRDSFEAKPDWPLWEIAGLDRFSSKNRSRIVQSVPLKISDLVSADGNPPPAGPRWGRFLSKEQP
ncbi:MAG TPA: right-handed parallel beta-helix repeat-containing protein [Chthoniobacteraceae bacterium]|nr:right-handed parallel beta-helix repeat-containing protein [Chthoniobacteraceae bacterium]